MASTPLLRLGTRGSPLALAQSEETRRLLGAADPALADDGAVEIVVIQTTGDAVQDRPLAEVGGKGLFTKEIDEALLDRRIDLAVHSMKDVPTWLPDGIVLAAMLERQDPRDVFISPHAETLAGLASGSVVGTASLRRQAQVLHRRPDLVVEPFRGNVQTRLRKLDAGEADATLLALAGLRRLGLADDVGRAMATDEILPAVGQGAIGITCRTDDDGTRGTLATIDHPPTTLSVIAERAMLEVLDGSCRTPIAGLAEIDGNGDLALRALIARPDGSEVLETDRRAAATEAAAIGRDAGDELRRRAGPGFLDDSG
jgi:hydroxymethylbilane synthase